MVFVLPKGANSFAKHNMSFERHAHQILGSNKLQTKSVAFVRRGTCQHTD
jgi:hypothetical protein